MTAKQLKAAYKVIGAQIKQRREELGISQYQVERDGIIKRNTLINIEHGYYPATLDNIVKVCKYLGIDSINFTDKK